MAELWRPVRDDEAAAGVIVPPVGSKEPRHLVVPVSSAALVIEDGIDGMKRRMRAIFLLAGLRADDALLDSLVRAAVGGGTDE